MTEELVPINTVSHQLGEHPGMPLAMLPHGRQFLRFWTNYRMTCAEAIRDGISPSQACAIIEDREHVKMTEKAARERLDQHIAKYRKEGNGI